MELAPLQVHTSPQGPLEIGTGPSRNHHHATNNREFHDGSGDDNNNPTPKLLWLRGFLGAPCSVKKEKRKFWIALSREEIEEDIFSVFPGLWLVGITADDYRVADTPAKDI
ncbi:hypothetical protein GmHk_01G001633 [Glycine max]|nr:hypothetical protein GmHk_01G001633 [Glycine max]